MTWNTDTADFAEAIAEFEAALPGFWWSVGQCSVGAHASCAVDGNGVQAHLIQGIPAGHPCDAGFHCDTNGGSPADALRDVMRQAVEFQDSVNKERKAQERFGGRKGTSGEHNRSPALGDRAQGRKREVGMMAPNYPIARQKAVELLKTYNFDTPPIDPEAIAEAEGIDVLYVDFGDFSGKISGLYDFESNRILVNKSIPDNRKTFTIAHELAHALLHKEYATSGNYSAMPRSNVHVNKLDEEREADVFAACLLVPKAMLKKYKSYASVSELARMFAVSEDVVAIQSKQQKAGKPHSHA